MADVLSNGQQRRPGRAASDRSEADNATNPHWVARFVPEPARSLTVGGNEVSR
jgi:hypothetical protein